MNTLEACIIESPNAEIEDCAKFIIDEVLSPFVLQSITVPEEKYTLSLWVRSDNNGSIVTGGATIPTTTEWVRHAVTFSARSTGVSIYFNTVDNYYVYHPKLENGSKATDWTEAPEDISQRITDVNNDLRQVISDNHTSIIQDCEQIILGALESYAETNDFESFKRVTESQLKVLSDEMTLQFTQTTNRITDMNDSLQEQLNTITKYFTFDINGLTIGQRDNPYKVIIDNDRYSMTVNDMEVMWIADGKVYTPEIEVTRAFKLFGYTIEQDQNGNVNCAYVGGES